MAERIISPGVITKETDLSVLPESLGTVGAVIIGPSVKGPAFVPVLVASATDFVNTFGEPTDDSYASLAAYKYAQTSQTGVTFIRVLDSGGYNLTHPINLVLQASGSGNSAYTQSIAVLHPSYVVTNTSSLFSKSISKDNSTAGALTLVISGSFSTDVSTFTNATNKNGTAYSSSIDSDSSIYVGNIFGVSPKTKEPVYLYTNFKNAQQEILAWDTVNTLRVKIETGSASSWNFASDSSHASTPWVTSQKISGDTTSNLFRFHTLSHGTTANHEIFVGIENITKAGTVPGSEYGSFDVVIKTIPQDKIIGSPFGYTQKDTLETFRAVTLDPNSPDFIARRIGDRNTTVASSGRLAYDGNFANNSKFIRVEVDPDVRNAAAPVSLVPFGFRALYSPLPSTFTQPVSASYRSTLVLSGILKNTTEYYGFNLDFSATDNLNYLKPLPTSQTTGSNADFYLGDYSQDDGYTNSTYTGSLDLTNSFIGARKFAVPFQGGFDGRKPNTQVRSDSFISSTNMQGFNLSSNTANGYVAYKKAINVVSNPEILDLNILAIPGPDYRLHSTILNYALQKIEDRADVFFIMDPSSLNDSVTTAINSIQSLDSSYAGVYYPWLKLQSPASGKIVNVPPSTIMPALYVQSDLLADPWFAPAGLNRARLAGLGVVDVVSGSLHKEDRTTLYRDRINPITRMSSVGVAPFGQKTLQARPSALDRINVRRLLIEVKKFIANTARFFVFQQNTPTERARFENLVNPYLDSIKQRQGLDTFRVIVDETVNTPEVISRNQMLGKIQLKPTYTIEVIELDFQIFDAAASFDE